MSRSLYSDYQTVVGFYLRRMGLLKHFGIDARFPLLDHRLIEYCARIPSDLKIKGNSDTKYIFKKAMEKGLPYDIVYRKDKLGHSIPMKTWMRVNAAVKQFISDQLSESTIKRQRLFNPAFIKGLMDQHLSKTANFSHRQWALSVFESICVWGRIRHEKVIIMISEKTIFILGAGSSYPFGFPLGKGLREDICKKFVPKYAKFIETFVREEIKEIEVARAEEFKESFLKSSITSVDKFLYLNPHFEKYGKFAIIISILDAEKNSKFREEVEMYYITCKNNH